MPRNSSRPMSVQLFVRRSMRAQMIPETMHVLAMDSSKVKRRPPRGHATRGIRSIALDGSKCIEGIELTGVGPGEDSHQITIVPLRSSAECISRSRGKTG